MNNEIALRDTDLLGRCPKCNSTCALSHWRENNGCQSEKCKSEKAILLSAFKGDSVEINGEKELVIISNAKTLMKAMLYTVLIFLAPYMFASLLSHLHIIDHKSGLAMLFFRGLFFCQIVAAVLMITVDSNVRKQLVLSKESKSINIDTTLFGYVVSSKKDFRREGDSIEVQLRVNEFTSAEFAEFIDLCRLEGNGIPSIAFQCDLLLDDQSLIRLFELNFVGDDRSWQQRSPMDLISNKEEPDSFLSVIGTAQEIGKTLDIPLRIMCKDSICKGKRAGEYVDL